MTPADSIAETLTRGSEPSRPADEAAGTLHVVFPPSVAHEIALGHDPMVLGRRPEGAAVAKLSHATVSRRHLEVRWLPGDTAHLARDLGSHNGSRHNGHALGAEGVTLRDGDVLRLGDVCLVYERDRVAPALGGSSADDEQAARLDAVPGHSAAMRRLRASIARAGRDPSPVLVTGETGTGKEWVARELHRLSGRRGPLLAVNCAALSPLLVESQLFGHARGAFTGAQSSSPGIFRAAQGGTVLLDEVGELAPDVQAKLLRVLQEKEVLGVGETRAVRVDARVIGSTLRDLGELARTGAFRLDLYARLSLWELRVPPLRERRADLLDWIARLAERWHASRSTGVREPPELEADAAELLLTFDWPENLRGVDRLVHQICSAEGPAVVAAASLERLVAAERAARRPGERAAGASFAIDGASDRAAAHAARPRGSAKPEKPSPSELAALLEQHGGSLRAVAKALGRDRRQIYRWLEQYGMRSKP